MRCLIMLVLLSGTAFAQPPGAAPTVDPLFSKEVDSPDGPPKNLLSAYLITWASTAVPVALSVLSQPDDGKDATAAQNALGVVGVAGMLLGPSAGHWYVGEGVTTGLALRLTAAAGVGALAIGDPHMSHLGVWILGGITCVGVYEAGVIWDLATLPRSVRRYNKQHQLQLAPMATSGGTGLSVAGTF
jgi:hypothetical protein